MFLLYRRYQIRWTTTVALQIPFKLVNVHQTPDICRGKNVKISPLAASRPGLTVPIIRQSPFSSCGCHGQYLLDVRCLVFLLKQHVALLKLFFRHPTVPPAYVRKARV